jgi:hypothetical protein
MTAGQLLLAFTLGTAVLAIWSYLRWPAAAPATLKGAVIRIALALLLLQVGAAALGYGVKLAPAFAVVVVLGIVVPVLTYAFLASLWFLKICADQVRSAI